MEAEAMRSFFFLSALRDQAIISMRRVRLRRRRSSVFVSLRRVIRRAENRPCFSRLVLLLQPVGIAFRRSSRPSCSLAQLNLIFSRGTPLHIVFLIGAAGSDPQHLES